VNVEVKRLAAQQSRDRAA